MGEHTLKILDSLTDVDAEFWDRCATSDGTFNPFLTHAFLLALEESGSATSATGWQPFHIQVADGDEPIGVVPLYVKGHSQGEYVFDHSWADAWHRAGGN